MSVILDVMHNYMQNFPSEVPTKAAQGFIATAIINLVSGSTRSVALLGGAIAVTATIIEAVTRPIIQAIFPNNRDIASCIQVCTSHMMAVGLAASIAPWLGVSYTMPSLLLSIIAFVSLNERFYQNNVAMVAIP